MIFLHQNFNVEYGVLFYFCVYFLNVGKLYKVKRKREIEINTYSICILMFK